MKNSGESGRKWRRMWEFMHRTVCGKKAPRTTPPPEHTTTTPPAEEKSNTDHQEEKKEEEEEGEFLEYNFEICSIQYLF